MAGGFFTQKSKGGEEMAKKIGLILALDGEKEFNTAVSSCNKSLRQMKSEMNYVKEESKGQANTLETLQKKHKILTDILEEHKKKEAAVADGLAHAKENYQHIQEQLEKYRNELEKAEAALKEMTESGEASEDQIQKQRAEVERLNQGVAEGEKIYQKAADSIKAWETKLNNAKAQTLRANAELKTNAVYLQEAEKSADGYAKSIDAFGKKTEQAVEATLSWKNALKTVASSEVTKTIKDLAVNSVKDAAESMLDLKDAQAEIRASTGMTTAELKKYEEVLEEIYKSGYGESMGDLVDALSLIRQYTKETDPGVLKDMTENVMALEDTFGMDLSESIRGADALMKSMGLDAEEAFDYIVAGAQNGLNKSSELTDNLAEYSALWGQAGFSAQEMFRILQNGLDAGAYNLDKVNDFVKEFGNSLADGRIENSLDSFSDETKNLFYQWKAGYATTSQVFYSVIDDLDSMTNKQEALTLASETWSSLGEDNAMAVITALNDVNSAYDDVTGSAQKLKEVKYDTLRNEYQEVGRTIQQELIVPMLEIFLPGVQKGTESLTGHLDAIIPILYGITTASLGAFTVGKIEKSATAMQVVNTALTAMTAKVKAQTAAKAAETAADAASTVEKGANTAAMVAQKVATEGATVSQTKLNAAVLANPYVAAATALVGLTVALVSYAKRAGEASEESVLLADANERVCASADETAEAVKSAVSSYRDSSGEMKAQAEYAGILADRISALAEKTSLTSEEQKVMKGYISELNTLMPGLNLSYNTQSNTLSKTNSQIREYISLSQKELEIQAAQEYASELLKRRSELEIEAIQLKNESASLQEETNKLLEDENELMLKSSLNAFVHGKSDQSKTYKELTEAQEENSESMEANEEALNSLEEELAAAQTYLEEMGVSLNLETEALDENTGAQNANAEAAMYNGQMQAEGAASMITAAQGIADTYTGMQETVSDVLNSQMDMFEKFSSGTSISTEKLLSNMQSQIDGVTMWADNIASLSDRAINQDLLTYLAEMGPEGANYVAAFVSMTDEELQKASDLWSQSLDMKEGVNESVSGMLEAYTEALNGGAEQVSEACAQIGDGTIQGLVNAMSEGLADVSSAGQEVGEASVDGVADGAQTHSPSKATYETGQNIDEGLIQGMNSGRERVIAAGTEIASALVSAIGQSFEGGNLLNAGQMIIQSFSSGIEASKPAAVSAAQSLGESVQTAVADGAEKTFYVRTGRGIPDGLNSGIKAGTPSAKQAASSLARGVKTAASNVGSLNSVGLNLSLGLASGITSGKSSVVNAVASVCAAAVSQARRSLGIHSPSTVFAEIGAYSAEGYAKGYDEKMKDVNTAIKDSLNYTSLYGQTGAGSDSLSSDLGSASGMNRLTVELPIYVGNQYTKTEIVEIVMDGIERKQNARRMAKGVYAYA